MRYVFVFCVTFLAQISFSFACSCIWPDDIAVEKHFQRTDVVFRGVVIGLQYENSDDTLYLDGRAEFSVLESLKGIASERVIVAFPIDGGSNCGLSFKIGNEYEVFGGISDEGVISTTECAGTRRVQDRKEWSWEEFRKAARKN